MKNSSLYLFTNRFNDESSPDLSELKWRHSVLYTDCKDVSLLWSSTDDDFLFLICLTQMNTLGAE